MADVLFGQSYFLSFDPKLWRLMQPYPPLGTLIAAAYVRERGFEVALFDAMLARNEEEWGAALDRESPRFAVLYEDNFNYLSKMCLLRMREAGLTMAGMGRDRGATVIVCGSDATDHADAYLAAGADYVLLGEGEETLGELLDRLSGRGDGAPEKVLGLAFRGGSGETVHNGRRPVLRDLDALPFPTWDLVDTERYRSLWQQHHGYYSMNMVTTRGCPYHCNWCAKPIWGQTYNMRAPERVADELAWLDSSYSPDHIWFADDIFGLKLGWVEAFADALEERGVRVPFKCLSRVDLLLRDGEVEALRRAGAETVWVGAESGSQKILDAMDKGTRVEQIHEARARLGEAGIRVGFFLQFGYPGEEEEDVESTRRMVRECLPDEIGMSVSYPLPGTDFHRMVRDQLGAKQNWVDSDDLDMMHAGTFTSDYYRQLYAVLHKDHRSRRLRRELAPWIRRPLRTGPPSLRELAALGDHSRSLPLA
ncbi:MAG: radical SAM protein, partial [Thermoanaerobaculia bacterium]|nr:radical SAM protein [Thermoanaerobaculia bacterium]